MSLNLNNNSSNIETECTPLKHLHELIEWQPDNRKHITEILRERNSSDKPKTLICHDMKGGYQEDRFLNGVKKNDCFYFIHWSLVDIFVYFSHNLVTIPPCGWISAAHRNGVKVLGTFITEWDEGANICDKFLCDSVSICHIVNQLVKIALHYNFEGWLINIENKIKISQINFLEEFIKELCLKMHKAIPNSLIIWYDSIITTGELKWQNALNENNKNFFHSCDGIFLNYNWTDDHLKKSLSTANERKNDIFVGVDVFGRGCLGGGGFCTDIAVRKAREYGLSVAIFAPGWVHECLDTKDFMENQYKFWNSLSQFCLPRKIKSLPYFSTFCPGFGNKLFRNGEVINNEPWFNLSLQQLQSTFHYTDCSVKGGSILLSLDDAYNGGACIKLVGNTTSDKNMLVFEILSTDFDIEETCIINYVFKMHQRDTDIRLILTMKTLENQYELHLVDNFEGTHSPKDSFVSFKYPASAEEISSFTYAYNQGPKDYSKWDKRTYLLKVSDFFKHKIDKVSIGIDYSLSDEKIPFSLLLGQLEILPVKLRPNFICKDLTYNYENNNLILECLLEWSLCPTVYCWDLYYKLSDKKKFIGTTSQSHYHYKTVICTNTDSFIEFLLYPQYQGILTYHPMSMKVSLPFPK